MTEQETLIRRWQTHVPRMMDARYGCAVLCPFVETADGLSLLLEVRAATLRRQPGEVCFPGGRMEAGECAADCALREMEEELHIPSKEIRLWGQSDFIASAAGFTLQPVLGSVTPQGLAQMAPSAAEVAEVFTVPTAFFRQTAPAVYKYTLTTDGPSGFPYETLGIRPDYRWASGTVEVPVWRWDGRIIWGMTARIIRHIL